MSNWAATPTVPPAWSEVCDQSDSLFHSESWLALLERSFGCRSLYLLDEEQRHGAAISQFRAGPFRIGYLGFPIGGTVGDVDPGVDIPEILRQVPVELMPVAIRIPASGFGMPVDLGLQFEATNETAIVDLQAWSLERASKNRKRDVKRSLHSDLEMVDANDPADADRIYELYRKTLERHDGSLRYNAAYFSGLIRLATEHPKLRVLLAKTDGSICAFTVVAQHSSVGYYLHGAIDWSQRALRPSAMLMNNAIEWAKAGGCASFNFLSSPPGQESLVRYKEAWGGETRTHRTYTLPVRSSFLLFKAAERLYRLVR